MRLQDTAATDERPSFAACGGHLGHVFKGERFNNPVDERHCVVRTQSRALPLLLSLTLATQNGISLRFADEQ